jgi:hypothetical protein
MKKSKMKNTQLKSRTSKSLQILIMCFLILGNMSIVYGESGRPYRKSGVHKGNLVKTVFGNYGVVGQPSDKGPRGAWIHENNGYIGDVSPFVGAQITARDTAGNLVTFHSVEVTPVDRPALGGHEESPSGTRWGFEPVSGYSNDSQGSVAMSTNPNSWPSTWPDKNASWAGQWNGYFGQVPNASEESYFVMDDDKDEEFNFPEYNTYNIRFMPDSTDESRCGLGLEVKVRGMQWSQFLAQDVIFWLYEVTNKSTTDYDQIVFGMLVGTYVGVTGTDDRPGEYDDDWSFFDVERDLTYTGDFDNNVSRNSNWVGSDVGMVGYAFLESPGNPYDGIDNDRDAAEFGQADLFTEAHFASKVLSIGDELVLIDNAFNRSIYTMLAGPNTVTTRGLTLVLEPGDTLGAEGNEILSPNGNSPNDKIVNPNAYDGIDNDLDGLIDENYYLHYRQIRKDEDGNILFDILNPTVFANYITGLGTFNAMIDEKRDDGEDNDGDWSEEFDDVGTDGVANTSDMDGTEGNGWPDSGEPNFDITDPDESDQIGLSSFNYFAPAGDIPMKNDEELWDMMAPGYFDVPASIQNGIPVSGEDGDFVYSSGYFPLRSGQTERFSVGLIYGDDHSDLLRNLETVKDIYDSDYRFPTAPLKPTLSAVPGDGKVTLYWDRRSEESIDPVLKIKDFEGYKIYRASDPNFNDVRTITNSLGTIEGYEPIAQFDLDNDVFGPFYPSADLFEQTDGYTFYLGDNTGLQHTYVDNDVQNGRRYYYAIVAYDKGDEALDIFPSENTKLINVSTTGEATFDINTLAITPGGTPPGYESSNGDIPINHVEVAGTGSLIANIVDPISLKDHVYKITFLDEATDGVDNDGDWDPLTDDVGKDGIAGTNDPDGTEGDGIPQNGEPNVEFSDGQELARLTTSYSVLDTTGFSFELEVSDTLFIDLGYINIADEYFLLTDANGNIVSRDYYGLRAEAGYLIPKGDVGPLEFGNYSVKGKHFPVYKSPFIFGSPYVSEAYDSDIFDGIQIEFNNEWSVGLVDSMTGWNFEGGYEPKFGTTSFTLVGRLFVPVKYPSDYNLVFADSTIYTMNDSAFMTDFFGMEFPAEVVDIPVNFKLKNVTEDYLPQVIFDDADQNGIISYLDKLLVFDVDKDGNYFFTWNILFKKSVLFPDSTFSLSAGDTMTISTTKPFRDGDVFIFKPEIPTIDESVISDALDQIKVWPNPYVAASFFESPLPPGITTGRGERRVTFTHIPNGAEIQIFTARGDHVRTLVNDGSLENSQVKWNLKTKENLDVAYGVYFYVVNTDFGQKTGKLAIIK